MENIRSDAVCRYLVHALLIRTEREAQRRTNNERYRKAEIFNQNFRRHLNVR